MIGRSKQETTFAPNYAEPQAAESGFDILHKLGTLLKELNESNVWLEFMSKLRLLGLDVGNGVLEKCVTLNKIIAASRRTHALNAGKISNVP